MPGRYNEILAGRFNRGLQKIFQMKGGPPVPQLGSDISPNVEVESMLSLEHRILMSVRSFARSVTVAAGGAGNRSGYRMRNPLNSNVVAVLEKFQFITAGAAADSPFITRGPTTSSGDLTTADNGNESVRDIRMGAINSSLRLSSSVNTGAVIGTQQLQIQASTNGQAEGIILSTHEIVIAPGDFLTLYSNVLNQAISFNIMWRERALEETELQSLL